MRSSPGDKKVQLGDFNDIRLSIKNLEQFIKMLIVNTSDEIKIIQL